MHSITILTVILPDVIANRNDEIVLSVYPPWVDGYTWQQETIINQQYNYYILSVARIDSNSQLYT